MDVQGSPSASPRPDCTVVVVGQGYVGLSVAAGAATSRA